MEASEWGKRSSPQALEPSALVSAGTDGPATAARRKRRLSARIRAALGCPDVLRRASSTTNRARGAASPAAMPLKPYKKPAGRARYLLPQMNFVDPGAEAKTRRPRLPRGLRRRFISRRDEIRKRKRRTCCGRTTRGHSRVIDGFCSWMRVAPGFPDEGHRADVRETCY